MVSVFFISYLLNLNLNFILYLLILLFFFFSFLFCYSYDGKYGWYFFNYCRYSFSNVIDVQMDRKICESQSLPCCWRTNKNNHSICSEQCALVKRVIFLIFFFLSWLQLPCIAKTHELPFKFVPISHSMVESMHWADRKRAISMLSIPMHSVWT